jgi:hypothetical protein
MASYASMTLYPSTSTTLSEFSTSDAKFEGIEVDDLIEFVELGVPVPELYKGKIKKAAMEWLKNQVNHLSRSEVSERNLDNIRVLSVSISKTCEYLMTNLSKSEIFGRNLDNARDLATSVSTISKYLMTNLTQSEISERCLDDIRVLVASISETLNIC